MNVINNRRKYELFPDGIVKGIKNKFHESDLVFYVLLAAAYLVISVPDILSVPQFHKLLFPLNFLYFSETLFSGLKVNAELAHTVISPTHANLIYPPGIYILSSVLGSVRNMFYFLFVVQAVIPLLVFKILRSHAPRVFAFSIAILLTYYCTSVNTWYPDFIIQPLMIGILFVLLKSGSGQLLRLMILGLATGIVIVLKHNIGVFLLILCGVHLFLNSIIKFDNKSNKRDQLLVYIIFFGFAVFGFLFIAKLPNWFDKIIFLAPYFLFWVYVFNLFNKNTVELDGKKFINDGITYAMWSLMLPLVVFVYFGSVVGYQRYWYSLFGMGLDYLAFWNNGVLELIRGHIHVDGYGQLYASLISTLILFGPFLLNTGVVVNLYTRNGFDKNIEEVLDQLKIISVGVMAVFMLFPLEDIKIAQTKLFIFVFVFIVLMAKISVKRWRYLTIISLLMLIPVATGAYGKVVNTKKSLQEIVRSSDKENTIRLPLNQKIDHEISAQISTLKNSIKGQGYFIFTSPTYNLLWLPTIVANDYAQNYVRFDDVIMNRKISDATVNELKKINYVVVAADEYNSYSKNDKKDSEFGRIMSYIIDNYFVIDRYIKPNSESPATLHMDSFMVLKRSSS